jgi:hypothetical protein
MLLDKNRSLERATRLALRSLVVVMVMIVVLFLLDTDQHLCKQIAFQLLPRLAIFTDVDFSMQAKLPKSG